VVIHPATTLNLASCRASLILWYSCLSSILAGCCATSHHATTSCLPAPLPTVLLLPFAVCHDWLLHCSLHLSLHHRIPSPSAWASTFLYSLPPPPATNFICPLLLRLIDLLSFCQLWQWAKASIPTNHDGNGNGNDGGNVNSNSNSGGNGIRDYSSASTPIFLSLFDCCMFNSGFGFAALLSLPHHLPPLPLPHLPTPLSPTTPPPAFIYHHHWLIVKYFIISFLPLLLCLSTSFVDGMGFVALLLTPIIFSLSHRLLSYPSVAHHIQLAHHHKLIVIFKGRPLLAHCHVSPPVVLMRWASLCLSPLPPTSPSPLTTLTCPSIAHWVLLGSQSSTILVDCYFSNCRWSKGDDFVIVVVGLCRSCPPPCYLPPLPSPPLLAPPLPVVFSQVTIVN
jgi:hypothetical protein